MTNSDNTVMLSWNSATDGQTPASGFSYNVRAGTTPGGNVLLSAHVDATNGFRRVPALGNAMLRHSLPTHRPDQRPDRVLERASRGHRLRRRPLRHRDECVKPAGAFRLPQLSTLNSQPFLVAAHLRLDLATKPRLEREQLDCRSKRQRESRDLARDQRGT